MQAAPKDCTLLPLASGALLVSPGHATFCRIEESALPAVRAALAGEGEWPASTRSQLARHGFFGPPRESAPVAPSVQLQLTNACNLACSYCCTNSGPARPIEIGREHFFRVVDEVRESMGPGARVSLLGGEPLLVPFALELAERILEVGLSLVVFTNGLLLEDEEVARRVAGLMARGAEVRVSLAGATPATCDEASGAPRFERVLRGLHTLARFGHRAVVDVMLTPADAKAMAEELHTLRSRLPPGTRIALGLLFKAGREKGQHTFHSRAELEAALDRVAFEAGEVIHAQAPSPVAPRREGCSCALGHHLHVRSDGALFTCFRMEEKVGDLATTSFAEALASTRARPRPARTLRRCVDCPLATLCGGGCRAENLLLTGDADEPACGPWRVRVLSELLAEDRVGALEWPAEQLLAEARQRGIEGPAALNPVAERGRTEGRPH